MKPSEPKNKKNRRNAKNNQKKILEEICGHNISPKTLVFLVFLFSLGFFKFLVFLNPVAAESFGV